VNMRHVCTYLSARIGQWNDRHFGNFDHGRPHRVWYWLERVSVALDEVSRR